MLADHLRRVAWAELGLDTTDAGRLAREAARLVPSGDGPVQRARDVIDIDERARLMRAIAAAYARIHLGAPRELAWSAFAAIAVNDGVRPTVELALLASRVVRIGVIEDAIKCAFEANLAIYADLAWVHHAYLAGGARLIEALHRSGDLADDLADAFTTIARGDVLAGNLALFRREQDLVVTPIFARYHAALALATRIGLIAVPGRALAARCEALGASPRWTARKSYAPFPTRWRWLVERAWRPFSSLGRVDLDAALARARLGRAEA